MFGLGGNNEDDQRLWNMIFFKVPMSDKEIEDASPVFAIILALLIIGGLIWWAVS
jgi:hypothetical protein